MKNGRQSRFLAMLLAVVIMLSCMGLTAGVNAVGGVPPVSAEDIFWSNSFTGTAGTRISSSSAETQIINGRFHTMWPGGGVYQTDPSNASNSVGYFTTTTAGNSTALNLERGLLNIDKAFIISSRLYLTQAEAGQQAPLSISFAGKQLAKFTYDNIAGNFIWSLGANADAGRVNLGEWFDVTFKITPGSGSSNAEKWAGATLTATLEGNIKNLDGSSAATRVTQSSALAVTYQDPVIDETGKITSGWGSAAYPRFKLYMPGQAGDTTGIYLDDILIYRDCGILVNENFNSIASDFTGWTVQGSFIPGSVSNPGEILYKPLSAFTSGSWTTGFTIGQNETNQTLKLKSDAASGTAFQIVLPEEVTATGTLEFKFKSAAPPASSDAKFMVRVSEMEYNNGLTPLFVLDQNKAYQASLGSISDSLSRSYSAGVEHSVKIDLDFESYGRGTCKVYLDGQAISNNFTTITTRVGGVKKYTNFTFCFTEGWGGFEIDDVKFTRTGEEAVSTPAPVPTPTQTPASNNTKLSSLTYSAGTASAVAVEGFSSADFGRSYEVLLAEGNTSATVVASAAEAGASISYTPAGGTVDVSSGSGSVVVSVTAADGATTDDYTVNFSVPIGDSEIWSADYTDGTAGTAITSSSVDPLRWNTMYEGSSTIQTNPKNTTRTAGYFQVGSDTKATSLTHAKGYLNLQGETVISTGLLIASAVSGSQEPMIVRFGGHQVAKFTFNTASQRYIIGIGAANTAAGSFAVGEWVRLNLIITPGSGETAAQQWSATTLKLVVNGDLKDVDSTTCQTIAAQLPGTYDMGYVAPTVSESGTISAGWGSGALPRFELRIATPPGTKNGYYLDRVRIYEPGTLNVTGAVADEVFPDKNVQPDGSLIISFNHDLNVSAFSASQIQVQNSSGVAVPVTSAVLDPLSPDKLIISFADNPLSEDSNYRVVFADSLCDMTGRTVGAANHVPFTTAKAPGAPVWDQTTVDQAIAASTTNMQVNTNFSWRDTLHVSEAMYILSLMSYYDPNLESTGGVTVSSRLIEHLRSLTRAGREPSCRGGLGGWVDNPVAQSVVLAKNTPDVWNQLTTDEKNRLDFIMKCMAVAGNYTQNYNNNPKTDMSQISTYEKGWNPNIQEGYVGVMAAVYMYFGGAAQVNQILTSFDYDTYIAQMDTYGFTNVKAYFEATGKTLLENGGTDALGGQTLGAKQAFVYKDPVSATTVAYTPFALYSSLANRMYSLNCATNIMEGTLARGYISDGSISPFEGRIGMCLEFRSMDASGVRTSADYITKGWRNSVPTRATIEALGYWDSQNSSELECRMYVGSEDFLYKISDAHGGYIGYSNGGVLSAYTESHMLNAGEGFRFYRDIWHDYLKRAY